jgi:hypothetical protein
MGASVGFTLTLAARQCRHQPDPNAIYGIPDAVVTNVAPSDLKTVEFQYWDESDGVNLQTGTSFPFYPIPSEFSFPNNQRFLHDAALLRGVMG